MSDRYVFSCRKCGNAIVASPSRVDIYCPVCDNDDPEAFNQEGSIR
jgi:rubrerythrin